MSKFQIIVLAIFVVCIGVGVALFATYKGGEAEQTLPTVTVWGTFPASIFSNYLQEINSSRQLQLSVNYIQKNQATFDKEFIETLARGQGPDAILIPQDMFARHSDKLIPIPYSVLTERDFRNAYIAQAEVYLTNSGTIALPLTVDPLVMYWNRDIFTNAGIAKVPVYWDEFESAITKINQKDANSNIRRSTLALGEFSNLTHAREILSALFFQSGNPITVRGQGIESAIGDRRHRGTQTSVPAVEFFLRFSNPQRKEYSWNRSLPQSKNWFLSGSLATYFGFASELFDIRNKNANIDFDVAPLPQARGAKNRATYGSMYGFSIVRTTADQLGTYQVLQALTAPESLSLLSKLTYLPPIRRDMIATGSTDPYQTIFYDSALISKGWLDTDASRSEAIFQRMVESVSSGRADLYGAIETASNELDLYLQNP